MEQRKCPTCKMTPSENMPRPHIEGGVLYPWTNSAALGLEGTCCKVTCFVVSDLCLHSQALPQVRLFCLPIADHWATNTSSKQRGMASPRHRTRGRYLLARHPEIARLARAHASAIPAIITCAVEGARVVQAPGAVPGTRLVPGVHRAHAIPGAVPAVVAVATLAVGALPCASVAPVVVLAHVAARAVPVAVGVVGVAAAVPESLSYDSRES